MLDIEKRLSGRGAQQRVADFFLKRGIHVSEEGRLFLAGIELSDIKVARAIDVDRRLIKVTVNSILKDEKLKKIFTKLSSTPLLRDVAPELGFGAIEIIPTNASGKGIVADVTGIITDADIAIRQVIAEDPMFENAELTIVTERPIPRTLIDKILDVEGVKKVVVLS